MSRVLFLVFLFALTPLAYSQGAYLGVQLDGQRAANSLPRIAGVEQPSAASLMGLQQGDVILAIDDVQVANIDALLRTLGHRLPGEIVQLRVFRGTEEITLTGILGRKPGDRKQYQPAMPTMPAWPGMPGLHEWPAMPDFPGFDQLQDWQGFEERFDFPQFQLEFPGDAALEREVHITYPESTPEAEREALIEEAKAQYGEDAVVEFRGNMHTVSIRQSSSPIRDEEIPSPLEPQDEDDEL